MRRLPGRLTTKVTKVRLVKPTSPVTAQQPRSGWPAWTGGASRCWARRGGRAGGAANAPGQSGGDRQADGDSGGCRCGQLSGYCAAGLVGFPPACPGVGGGCATAPPRAVEFLGAPRRASAPCGQRTRCRPTPPRWL